MTPHPAAPWSKTAVSGRLLMIARAGMRRQMEPWEKLRSALSRHPLPPLPASPQIVPPNVMLGLSRDSLVGGIALLK